MSRSSKASAHHRRYVSRAEQPRTLTVSPAMPAWQLRQTSPRSSPAIDRLLDDHTDAEIAAILNDRGLRSGGESISPPYRGRIRNEYELESRYNRLRARGLLDQREIAEQLDVSHARSRSGAAPDCSAAHALRRQGPVPLRAPRPDAPITKIRGRALAKPQPARELPPTTDEVQCEA